MYSIDDFATLCRALDEAELEVELLEIKLEKAKDRVRMLKEDTGPSMMQELGLSEIKLGTGQKITVKQEVYSQLSKDDKPYAYKWLDDNGFGGLIKTAVQVDFTRGEIEKAKKMVDDVLKKGRSCSLIQDVHSQTMKAFLREQISAGNTKLPLDLFGARPVWQLKIK